MTFKRKKTPVNEKNRDRVIIFSELLIFLFLAGTLFGTACSASDTGTTTITDQRGELVTIPENVERVITIPIPAASMVFTLDGGGDRLVGINPVSMTAIEDGILGDMDPDMCFIETGFIQGGMFEPNVEEVLNLEPDVVFQWADYGEGLYKPLENVEIPVICLKYGTQQDLETWIQLFGKVLDKEEKANSLIEYHHSICSEIEEKTSTIEDRDKPRILYLPYGDELKVCGTGTYNNYYFELTGAVNVAEDLQGFGNQVSMEQIIDWNPDIIYIGNFDDLTPDEILSNSIEGQDWSAISAVKNGRVYKIPLGGYRWDPPNQESPLMWEWLTEVQYPSLFDFNVRDDIKKFYQTYYDYELSEEQIDGILRTSMNPVLE